MSGDHVSAQGADRRQLLLTDRTPRQAAVALLVRHERVPARVDGATYVTAFALDCGRERGNGK